MDRVASGQMVGFFVMVEQLLCVCKVGDEKWKSGLRWRNNKVVVVLSIVCQVARWPERRKKPILELRYFTVVCRSNGS